MRGLILADARLGELDLALPPTRVSAADAVDQIAGQHDDAGRADFGKARCHALLAVVKKYHRNMLL